MPRTEDKPTAPAPASATTNETATAPTVQLDAGGGSGPTAPAPQAAPEPPVVLFPADAKVAPNAPPIAAPAPAGPVVNVHVAAAAVLVTEYYTLDYCHEVNDPRGTYARIVKGKDPLGADDQVVRYNREEGTALHCKTTEARVTFADGRGKEGATAQPLDGRPALKYGPGTAGCFGFPAPVGR